MRRFHYMPRLGGKTHACVHEFIGNPNSALVVFNKAEKTRILATYREAFKVAPEKFRDRIIVAGDPTKTLQLRGLGDVDLIVDNAEMCLEAILGRPVSTITLTRF